MDIAREEDRDVASEALTESEEGEGEEEKRGGEGEKKGAGGGGGVDEMKEEGEAGEGDDVEGDVDAPHKESGVDCDEGVEVGEKEVELPGVPHEGAGESEQSTGQDNGNNGAMRFSLDSSAIQDEGGGEGEGGGDEDYKAIDDYTNNDMVRTCTFIYVRVCIYVCMYICMYVYMYV